MSSLMFHPSNKLAQVELDKLSQIPEQYANKRFEYSEQVSKFSGSCGQSNNQHQLSQYDDDNEQVIEKNQKQAAKNSDNPERGQVLISRDLTQAVSPKSRVSPTPIKVNKNAYGRKSQKISKQDQINRSLSRIKSQKHSNRFKYIYYSVRLNAEYILMPILILTGTVMCLLSLFVWNFFNQEGNIQLRDLHQLGALDLAIALCLSLELVQELGSSHSLRTDIFKFQTLSDMALIIDLIWRYFQMTHYRALVFFYILRSLRITKLRDIINTAYNHIQQILFKMNTNDSKAFEQEESDEQDDLKRFVFDSIVQLISGLLIQSTFFLTVNQFSDHKGFHLYDENPKRMGYIDAAYFTIVSFSTIGYGDIYPTLWYTRLAECVILVFNITILSSFLGKFIEYLFKLSPYDTSYQYKGHVVIIGDISDEQLQDFLEELSQNDLVFRDMEGKKFSEGIQTLILVNTEPTENQRDLATYYTDQIGNEVSFLKESLYSTNNKWYAKANLKQAKILFAFSSDNDLGTIRHNDQLISFISLGVKEKYPDLRLILILNSTFKDEIKNDTLYNGIEAISPFQLNDFVLASSIINQGMGTILQHLLTMKTKVVSKEFMEKCQDDKFMLEYITNMQQQIYQFPIPQFFIGLSFKDCVQMLYTYGLKLSSQEDANDLSSKDHTLHRNMTAFAVETQVSKLDVIEQTQSPSRQRANLDNIAEQDEINFFLSSPNATNIRFVDDSIPLPKKLINLNSMDDNPFASVSVTKIQARRRESRKSMIGISVKKNKTKTLINPQNYQLRRGDVLYVICDDHIVAQDALLINSKKCHRFVQFLTNQIVIQKRLLSIQDVNGSINSMIANVDRTYKDFDLSEVDPHTKKKDLDSEKTSMLKEVYDFETDCKVDHLQGHFLIFGNQQSFLNMLQVIRKYTDRPAVLFTDQKQDIFKWKEQKSEYNLKNIIFIRGDFMDLTHLDQLSIKEAFHITIMSDLGHKIFSDAVGICIARIILDHYDRNDFLIELRDKGKISFLNNNPKLKSIRGNTLFYPAFVSGNVHLTSIITGILARVVYHPNWLQFFQHLTVPKNFSKDSIKQNKTVHCLRVTRRVQDEFKQFGLLQYAFIDHPASIIAIGVIKQAFSSRYKDSLIDKFQSDEFTDKIYKNAKQCETSNPDKTQEKKADGKKRLKRQISDQVQGILKKLMGENYVLVNPSFYTKIEESDGILCLGDLNIQQNVTKTISPNKILSYDVVNPNLTKQTQTIRQGSDDNRVDEKIDFDTKNMSQENKQFQRLKNIPTMYKNNTRSEIKQEVIQVLKEKYQTCKHMMDRCSELFS